jgi:hypothetical protein
MALSVQVSEMIDRPVSEVFDFYAHRHIQNHPRWDPQMHLEQVSDGPIDVGTVIRRRNTHSGTLVEGTMEVVEFEADRVFAAVINDGSTVTHGRVTFEAKDDSLTKMTIGADFMHMDEPMREFMTSLMQRSARNIKSLIESERKALSGISSGS